MRKLNILTIIFVSLLVVGCESVNKYGYCEQYKQQPVQLAKPISVPKGLSCGKIDTYYKVPAVKKSAGNCKVSILPPGSSLKGN